MPLISNIYRGPTAGRSSTGTSKGLAKREAGSKSGRWNTNHASDSKPKTQPKRVVDYCVDVHTPVGVIRGVNVQKNDLGYFTRFGGIEMRIDRIYAGCYVKHGTRIDQCSTRRLSSLSPSY